MFVSRRGHSHAQHCDGVTGFLCNFGVRSMWPRSGPFNPSPKKYRERDKAQHMPLCVPHVVQARVDELTEMSDLGPTS